MTPKIIAKMALDDLVKARTIDVTTDGPIVTLSGRVHSEAERDRAVRLAARNRRSHAGDRSASRRA